MKKRIFSASLIVLAASCEPWFAIDFCGRDQCDDGDECTIDVCIEQQCQHFEAEESEDGGCVQYCYTNDDCDDNKYCTGFEFCHNGICEASESPCLGLEGLELCDEEKNRCYQCDDDSDCGMKQWCQLGLCIGYCPWACGDDGPCFREFCFGTECRHYGPQFCGEGERCDPATGSCVPTGHLCLSQCDITDQTCCALDSPSCEFKPLDSFGNYSATRADWGSYYCNPDFSWAVAGVCSDGTQVLRARNYNVPGYRTMFYSTNGEFQSVLTNQGTDLPDNCFRRGYWPTEPTCDFMTVSEVICGIKYDVGDEVYFDICRSECGIDDCADGSIESTPSFDETIERWTALYCPIEDSSVYSGLCADGTKFVVGISPSEDEVQFFDAASGKFIAKQLEEYSAPWECCFEFYWPARVNCKDPIVVTNHCGTSWPEPGDSVSVSNWPCGIGQ